MELSYCIPRLAERGWLVVDERVESCHSGTVVAVDRRGQCVGSVHSGIHS